MKECINCKTILEDDELFCHECGTKQEIEKIEVKAEEPTEEGKKCIHCDELIDADSMFCPFCGKPQVVEEEKPEEPQQEPVETEPELSKESEPVSSPQPEQVQPEEPQQEPVETEPELSKESEPVSYPQTEQAQPKEEPTVEGEEKKKSKAWLWILLVLLIAGGASWYFLSGNNYGSEGTDPVEEVVDSGVEESDYEETDDAEYESEPSTKLAFLEKFYQEGRLETNYIKPRVTPEVLNRLRQAYGSDCDYGDCLGTWVFLAFPQGADARILDGPFISETSQPGIFKVDHVYSYYKDSSKSNETRTVYLTVLKSNGDYLISDFEVEDNSPEEINSSDEDEDDSFDTTTLVGKVSDYNIHMILNIRKTGVYGFYYYDSQGINKKVMLKGVISDGMMKLIKYDSYGKETGYFVGNFNGNTYQGKNVNYNRDEALPFSVEIVN